MSGARDLPSAHGPSGPVIRRWTRIRRKSGITCCVSIPRAARSPHIKISYDLTKKQYEKRLSGEKFETDNPVPPLPNGHDGYPEFDFLPKQKIEVQWVAFPTNQTAPPNPQEADLLEIGAGGLGRLHPHSRSQVGQQGPFDK